MKSNPIPMIAALLFVCISYTAKAQKNSLGDGAEFRLLLKSGSFIPEKNISFEKLDQFNRKALRVQEKTFAVIQFEKIPTIDERKQLQQSGIELLDYIPNNAYTVTITGSLNTTILTQLKARAVIELTAEQKIQPELAQRIFPPWASRTTGTVDVLIRFPKSFSYETVNEELRQRNFDIISNVFKSYRVVSLRIASPRLNELALLPFIEYVEAVPHESQPLNNKGTVNARTNVMRSALPGGRNLRGEGVVIGIGDNADPLRHIDFSQRFINRFPTDFQSHGVHVQGIAAGAGNLSEKFMGNAPKSTFIAQAFSNIIINAPVYVKDYGMVITNNSYGNEAGDCSSFGTYTLISGIVDQQAFELPQLQTVFASGNSGLNVCNPFPAGFRTVLGDFQSAKNVITVGNTDETGLIAPGSSRGPVKDGRIKPEVTAQGRSVFSTFPTNTYGSNSGTSMSTPVVSGGLALLYQRYRQLNSNSNPKNGLMKALVCNGATDMGNNGPDYTYGFGWMNLLRSVKMLEQKNYFNDSVSNSVIKTHTITVPVNTALLKVMLYWNDPAAAALAKITLVNDLDLEVVNPSSTIFLPAKLDTIPANVNNSSTTGADHLNNIEQVVINNPPAGTYSVKVKGTSVVQSPLQEYFLVYDTIPVSTVLTYPIGGEHLIPNDSIYISWDSYGDPVNTFTIEYSKNNGTSWITIANNVAANLRQFKWFVPSGDTTDKAKIRITRNGTGMISTSETFIIIGAPVITAAAIQCEGYFSIRWKSISKATDYEVMMLKADEMVSVATTTDTSYVFSGLSKDSVYWVTVRPRLNGTPGRRADAISRKPDTGDCSGAISNNDLKVDAILSPASSGRKFTSTSLSSSMPLTIRIKNLDDVNTSGNITVSYSVNGGLTVSEVITSPGIIPGGTLTHTFAAPINMSAVGSYQVKASVFYPGDGVSQNDTITKFFKQLDNPALNLTTTFLDDIETAAPQTITSNQIGMQGLDRYDFVNNTAYGRVSTFVNSGISYSGTKALTLDADRYVAAGNTDSLTGIFNLSSYDAATDDIRFDFRYKNHGQNPNAANKVWIRGNDQQPWIEIYDLYANQNDIDGSFKLVPNIEIADSLAAHSQNFSSSFQVRWGQWGKIMAASNDGSAGYTFDDIRLYKVINDIQLLSIDTPIVSSCGINANTPVKVTVHNSAKTTISAIPIVLKVDGVIITTASIASIAGNASIQYTFTSTIPAFAIQGNHTVQVWVDLNSDSYHNNDTASITLTNLPMISSFPYLENFESGNGNWHSAGKINSWEYGTPSSIKINRAASGTKAWKTRLAGNYEDLEYSYLYSPCFNISGMTAPTLSLSIALDLEDCGATSCDGAYMEYSSDGKIWKRLGTYNQSGSTNWYNKNYSINNLWSIQNYTRWHVATVPLPTGLTQLRLRFVLTADPAVNREGVAIDDIHIYDNTKGIYDGITMSTPVTQNISNGPNWIDFTSGGKLVASVNSPTQPMGSTNVQAYINTASVRNDSNQYYHDRNITIKPANNNLSDSVSVRFYYLDSEAERLINATGCSTCTKPTSAYELGIPKYNDVDDTKENGVITDNAKGAWSFIPYDNLKLVPFDKGYYAEYRVTNFSEFWLKKEAFNRVALPIVQISVFTATKKSNNDVLVEWTTTVEGYTNRFEIEVAKGNEAYQLNNFIKIGEVNSRTNVPQPQSYEFNDVENNKTGVRYYRLKIINNDGSFFYTEVRPVVFSDELTWQVFPNPSAGAFNLSFQLNNGETLALKIYDVNGRMIKQSYSPANGFVQKLNIDIRESRFAPGLYLLEIVASDKKHVFRLLKQ
ncbi:MAG: S8 family serine peptidase [Bacteroidota bacterium]